MLFNNFLTFSDAAKFADIARTFLAIGRYGQSFTFWTDNFAYPFSSAWVPPFTSFSIAVFFKILGTNDFAVIASSSVFFILALVFVFLLTKKIFSSKLMAVLATTAVAFCPQLLMYATTGASESPFVFEIVACAYFISLRKKWGTFVAVLFLVLLYFTRPQAFIYIAGLILFYLLDRFKLRNALKLFSLALLVGLLVDRLVLTPFNGKNFLYSITSRGQGGVGQNLGGTAVSNSLRGFAAASSFPFLAVTKKVFYNLYNFYKLVPDILNPFLFTLFIIGLFRWTKDKLFNSFKSASIFMILVTLTVAALSVPFFRYIHPVIPLIYIFAVETLVWVVGKIFTGRKIVMTVSSLLILFFAVGPTLGIIFLDSRFERNSHNVGQPPVYVRLSWILRDNTEKGALVLTNLDTWGSWYGERKTVWFPLEPKQIIDPSTGRIPFDAIYLTSYLIDDENYYMGSDWRLIFNNPRDPKKWTCKGCNEIAKEFKLKGIFKIASHEDYERQDDTAILLVRK